MQHNQTIICSEKQVKKQITSYLYVTNILHLYYGEENFGQFRTDTLKIYEYVT